MLSDEVINKVIERVTRRIEETNTYVLKKMGESIAKIRTLTPTQAHRLAQIMRYGGDYDKIIQALAKMSKLNIQDIYKIFEEVAKSDYRFAKQFYKYRYAKYLPYEENLALQNQVRAIATLTAREYNHITRTMGFATIKNGKVVYTDIATTYQNMLDRAVLSISQGKTTFDEEMYSLIKELANSGIKTIDYASGRSYRVDSSVRQLLDYGITSLHNELQLDFGKQFDADGVEISVHGNPAPDHMYLQGKQFSISQYDKEGNLIKKGEFEKLQEDEDAVSYDGVKFPKISEETKHDRRAIGQYNCKHYIFSIILGVSEPAYTNEELQAIIDKNNKSFDFDGKHYDTLYEGTQLQRKLELELRKAKDVQIMNKASDIDKAEMAQKRINLLTKKYNELCKKTGLPTKLERARVSGYKKIAISKAK